MILRSTNARRNSANSPPPHPRVTVRRKGLPAAPLRRRARVRLRRRRSFQSVRQSRDNLCCLDSSIRRGLGAKMNPAHRPRGHGHLRVVQVGRAANLHPCHNLAAIISSRPLPVPEFAQRFAGLGARISDSPTRKASNPACRKRAISSRVSIPLSATFVSRQACAQPAPARC